MKIQISNFKYTNTYFKLFESQNWSFLFGKWKWSRSVMSNSFRPHGLEPSRLLHPWNFPGKDTGVGCYLHLQGIFLSQGLNLGFPHCRQTLYHLSHQGSPNPTNIRLNQLKLLIFDYFWPIHRAISYGSIWYIFTMWLGIQVYFLRAPCVAILWSLNMWQFFGEKNNQIKMIAGLMMSHLLISSMISAD